MSIAPAKRARKKFPLTRRKDGRYSKRHDGKVYTFSAENDAAALAEWERRLQKLSEREHGSELNVVTMIPVTEILPSPENDPVYGIIQWNDPDFRRIADDIMMRGILQPLIVSSDYPHHYIVSGHRRYAAALENGIDEVPCIIDPVRREDDINEFVRLLVAHNEQREKTYQQKFREEAVKTDPQKAYRRLIAIREEKAEIKVEAMDLGERKQRSKINRKLRSELLDAVLGLFEWIRKPTSDRKIHYELATMENPPLLNTNNPKSHYGLDDASYKTICRFLTQCRVEGIIPWEWISDETRTVDIWETYRDSRQFIRQQLDSFLDPGSYYRDLMQSQEHYVEVLAEKNTVASQVRNICGKYTIPMTSGKGFCSTPPRHQLMKRFRASGKDRLILLIIADLDPSGMYIAESFAKSMRDDFGVDEIHAIKIAVTPEQVEEFNLPKGPKVKVGRKGKKDDPRAAEFIRRHGHHVYEVEALPDGKVEEILDDAIRSVIDIDAYNYEVDKEPEDVADIETHRGAALNMLRGMAADDDDE